MRYFTAKDYGHNTLRFKFNVQLLPAHCLLSRLTAIERSSVCVRARARYKLLILSLENQTENA